jgi:hypothetical protein
LLLVGRWTDDQPDTFAAGGLLPHKFFSGLQGSLDSPDTLAHAPAARPPQGPQGLQGLECADSEPGDQVSIGSSQGAGVRGGSIGPATVEGEVRVRRQHPL